MCRRNGNKHDLEWVKNRKRINKKKLSFIKEELKKMDKEKLLDLLDKGIERSERWVEDATTREDWNDVSFYEGQKKAIIDIKSIVLNW